MVSGRRHPRPHQQLIARLGTLLALLLGLVLTQADQGHAFSIGLSATSEVEAITPNPFSTSGFTVSFRETLSCIPGTACGSGTTRYAVVGTSQATIPAVFQYSYAGSSSLFSVEFIATDLKGGLLARLRARQSTDSVGFEAVSCTLPGSCVAFSGGPEIPFPPDPQFTYVPITEIEGGDGLGHPQGALPFRLPVGPNTGIAASLQVTAGVAPIVRDTQCIHHPETCTVQNDAVFSLIASPPPGASFIEPVPEPTTLLLVGTTAAGLGLARWRQRRRKRAAEAQQLNS